MQTIWLQINNSVTMESEIGWGNPKIGIERTCLVCIIASIDEGRGRERERKSGIHVFRRLFLACERTRRRTRRPFKFNATFGHGLAQKGLQRRADAPSAWRQPYLCPLVILSYLIYSCGTRRRGFRQMETYKNYANFRENYFEDNWNCYNDSYSVILFLFFAIILSCKTINSRSALNYAPFYLIQFSQKKKKEKNNAIMSSCIH